MERIKRLLSLALVMALTLMSVPVQAADGSSVTINADYDGDGVTDFSWILPGVVKTETLKMADNPTEDSYPSEINKATFKAFGGKEVTVYTISIDTQISVEGSQLLYFDQMTYSGSRLYRKEFEGLDKIRKLVKTAIVNVPIPNGNGHTWKASAEGSYVQFLKTGYYGFAQHPYHPVIRDVDLSTGEWGDKHYENIYKYSAVFLNVVSASEAAALASANTTPALVAKPTASAVLVNGKSVAFDAYNIGGNNYFKLRDLAYILSGSEKQFDVGWDGTDNAITLTGGTAYTAVGGEMEGKGSGDKTPTATTSKIYLDGREVSFTAYNIEGNNYFKLRDVGEALDFNVSWDGASNTIVIATNEGYTAD